jgi:hypothetical protein
MPRAKIARSYKGSLEREFALIRNMDEKQRKATREIWKVKGRMAGKKEGSAGYARLAARAVELDNRIHGLFDKLEGKNLASLRAIKGEYDSQHTIYKARDEIRHRLIKDFHWNRAKSKKNEFLREEVADVAAVLKMGYGIDDFAAINKAKEIISSAMLKGQVSTTQTGSVAEESKGIIGTDLLLKGKKSKFYL